MKTALLFSLCSLGVALAVPSPYGAQNYAVKDSHPVPPQYRKTGKPSADHIINLRIGVKQGSFAELERHLYEVSDPDHARYGQHLSHEETLALVAPSHQSLDAVHTWLEDQDIRLDQLKYSPAKDWVMIALPVSEVERLLDTEYHVYQDDKDNTVVRTPQYSLPQALHQHIDVITPTNMFGNPKAMARPFHVIEGPVDGLIEVLEKYVQENKSMKNVCNPEAVTSLCLRSLYGTVDYVPQVPQLNGVAITAYLNETANYSDFSVYMQSQRPDAKHSYKYNYTLINGALEHQGKETVYYGQRDVEANLDVQTVGGIVYPTKFDVYATGGEPPFKPDLNENSANSNEPYSEFLQYILDQSCVPYTISTSYGDDEQTVPPAYARRVCEGFAQLGARGVTVLFSAGDSGVGVNGTCFTNDGSNTPAFTPEFPASCPYVTSVGATRNFKPEIVAYNVNNGYVSGSGVSNYFPRPAYQDAAVTSYLKKIGTLHQGLYNRTGRAYPDIAAQGYHFEIVYGGKNTLVDGTSAASPAAAGVLTLVNDALLADGKPTLGFLNPFLYKHGHEGFTDVTSGSTWGCGTSGFPAKKGWDLASGFGTPDFNKLCGALNLDHHAGTVL